MLAIDALERSLVLGGCSFCDSSIDKFHVLNEGGKYTSGVELAFHHSGMLKVTVFDMVGSAAIEELVRLHVCPVCGKAL